MEPIARWFFRLGLSLISLGVCPARATDSAPLPPGIRRFGLYVGENEAGPGKPRLRYATTDATAIAKVMHDLGGVESADSFLVLDPPKAELTQRFQSLRARIDEARGRDQRTEILFYYSGHSDEEGLLLGAERFAYRQLRQAILDLAADVSVIILDSCASGNLTRLKGGRHTAPFLTDALSKLKGYVALTSSSNNESAQESDRIRGSYFTHFFVSGLRGAADQSSNNRVTLNEAYQYAYNETLARTERTAAGPQHPAYSIQLSGSGELVMTDLRRTASRLVLEKGLLGRIAVRDASDNIVAEVDKTSLRPISVAVEPGRYTLVWPKEQKSSRASIAVASNQAVTVRASDFGAFVPESTVTRGDDARPGAEAPFRRWHLIGTAMRSTVLTPTSMSASQITFGGMIGAETNLVRRIGADLFLGARSDGSNPPLAEFAFDATYNPIPRSDDDRLQLRLLVGGSSVPWTCGTLFGAPCDPTQIVATFHGGARGTWMLGEDFGLTAAARLNILQALLEFGFYTAL